MEQEVSFIAQTYCDEVFTWSGLKQQSNGKVDLKYETYNVLVNFYLWNVHIVYLRNKSVCFWEPYGIKMRPFEW